MQEGCQYNKNASECHNKNYRIKEKRMVKKVGEDKKFIYQFLVGNHDAEE